MINPKVWAIFVHTIVYVIFKYMLHVKNTKDLSNNNVGVLNHTKAHYGCYKIAKNDNLHIHTLLWFNTYKILAHIYISIASWWDFLTKYD
jgi:hypothetical protein